MCHIEEALTNSQRLGMNTCLGWWLRRRSKASSGYLGPSELNSHHGRRLLGTNGGSLWLWCCLAQPVVLGP